MNISSRLPIHVQKSSKVRVYIYICVCVCVCVPIKTKDASYCHTAMLLDLSIAFAKGKVSAS